MLAQGGAKVTVYDAMPSAGRKFLMAGRGGLNLTHSEPLPKFLARYREAMPQLKPAIEAFPPDALREWSEALGQPTFVGSSGRVFPKAFKASPLLRAWLRRLDAAGVQFAFRHRWTGWDADGRLLFQTAEGTRTVEAGATVLALGGASWPRLGSDGAWAETLAAQGVDDLAAQAGEFRLHRRLVRHLSRSVRGTAAEGCSACRSGRIAFAVRRSSPAPALRAVPSTHCRLNCARRCCAMGRPRCMSPCGPMSKRATCPRNCRRRRASNPLPTSCARRLASRRSRSACCRKPQKHPACRWRRCGPDDLARLINAVPIQLTGIAPIARAISTAGGIAFDELDADFMLRRLPGVFAAGEMLDWEAPTGGYLLQASFATGAAAGRGVLKWLANGSPRS